MDFWSLLPVLFLRASMVPATHCISFADLEQRETGQWHHLMEECAGYIGTSGERVPDGALPSVWLVWLQVVMALVLAQPAL